MNGVWLAAPLDWTGAIAWTLLHFVWQGALLASLCALLLAVLRGAAPNVRYVTALSILGLMLLAPIVTLAWIRHNAAASEKCVVLWMDTGLTTPQAFWRHWLPRIAVGAWLVGVLLFTTRLLGGFIRIQVVMRKALRTPPAEWQELVERLSERLGLHTLVRVVETAATSVPTVIGWLRPVILMPACAVTGLTRQQIEIVLAHELAHIRRHDYLVNLLQSGVETLLFYHPGVWWVSGRVREEREYCCDDLAIQVAGDPLSYARALTQLETVRSDALSLCPTAIGGSLMKRITRLLSHDPRFARRGAAWGPLLGALGAAGLSAGVSVQMAQNGTTPPGAPCCHAVIVGDSVNGDDAKACIELCQTAKANCTFAFVPQSGEETASLELADDNGAPALFECADFVYELANGDTYSVVFADNAADAETAVSCGELQYVVLDGGENASQFLTLHLELLTDLTGDVEMTDEGNATSALIKIVPMITRMNGDVNLQGLLELASPEIGAQNSGQVILVQPSLEIEFAASDADNEEESAPADPK